MEKRFVVGIDLGTSHTVACLTDTRDGAGSFELLPIVQCYDPERVETSPLLPSTIMVTKKEQFPQGSFELPWSNSREDLVFGAFAQAQAGVYPDQVVTSSKSWLSSAHVDRLGAILPWGATEITDKLSPFEAASLLLDYVAKALVQHRSEIDIAVNTSLVLTVPASFDEVARSLTADAAEMAGFTDCTLVEEPQAAFYSWIAGHEAEWKSQLSPGQVIMVVDIGGGTADFSMIGVGETAEGELSLTRLSVGEHILLGGDNIDLALGYTVKQKLESDGAPLDEWQFKSLVFECRKAKEVMLTDTSRESYAFSIASRGSSLFASARSTELTRAELEAVVLNGFFPIVEANEQPVEARSMGLQVHGLHYAQDPVFSKHIARFMHTSVAAVRALPEGGEQYANHVALSSGLELLVPDLVLFNGGVFNAAILRERVASLVSGFSGERAVEVMNGDKTDTAVAEGAAYFGAQVLQGEGIRIKASTTRSYYLGIESSMPAIPGMKPPLQALCVAPLGMEEGTTRSLPNQQFDLRTGARVEFPFFGSSSRTDDQEGVMLPQIGSELFPAGRVVMEIDSHATDEETPIPVTLESTLTEAGTLELWLCSEVGEARWKLEFNVREEAAAA